MLLTQRRVVIGPVGQTPRVVIGPVIRTTTRKIHIGTRVRASPWYAVLLEIGSPYWFSPPDAYWDNPWPELPPSMGAMARRFEFPKGKIQGQNYTVGGAAKFKSQWSVYLSAVNKEGYFSPPHFSFYPYKGRITV